MLGALCPADAAEPLRAVIADRGSPPDLGVLFPGLSFQPRGARTGIAALVRPQTQGLTHRLSRRRTVLRLRPGALQTPPYAPGLPWLSGTVRGGARDGVALPAAVELALDQAPDPALAARGLACARALVRHRVGGACWADPPDDSASSASGLAVIFVPAGARMAASGTLETVLGEQDAASVLVVLPTDTPADAAAAVRARGCRVLHAPVDPWPLIEAASSVHVSDGEVAGFLALLAGRTVRCHAPCWYSGWGLTVDAPGIQPRPAPRALAELAAAALLSGAGYADPFTGTATSCEAATALAAEWRRLGDLNRSVAGCVGMQFWKRRRIAQFLHTGQRPPAFPRGTAAALATARAAGDKALAAWSSRMPPDLTGRAAAAGIPVVRVEDGFIRSRGLGSDFLPPCSIILDGAGIYYDPSRPSTLETLLAETIFDPALLDRARSVVARLVHDGVTKYGAGAAPLPPLPAGKRLVLVPGQVADDLSVRLGGAGITSNAELLRRVREAEPDAYILYKPHPDVEAGHRPGAIPDEAALRHADQVVRAGSMAAWIAAVDAVHTLTSLAGFEAILRGRDAVCWGQPFYAGWGLTTDMAPLPRRTRRLRLEELAAGVLLLYPRYVDPVTGLPCPAEVLLDRLADPRAWRPSGLTRLRQLQGRVAKGLQIWLRPAMPAAGG